MDKTPKQQIVEKIKNSTNILVTVSDNPNVDELSAAIGFALILNKLDKHATAVFSGEVPKELEFLKPQKTLEDNTLSLRDFIISLDKDKADKLRYKVEDDVVRIFITPYRTKITKDDLVYEEGDFNVDLVIALGVTDQDHLDGAIKAHGRILHDATVATVNAGSESSSLGSIDWHNEDASCLCEMLVSVSEALKGGLLDKQMSTALLSGIVYSTDRFSNAKTTPKLMTMAAQLMAAGADQQLISTNLSSNEDHEKVLKSINAKSKDVVEEKPDGSKEISLSHDDESEVDFTKEHKAKEKKKRKESERKVDFEEAKKEPEKETKKEPEDEPKEVVDSSSSKEKPTQVSDHQKRDSIPPARQPLMGLTPLESEQPEMQARPLPTPQSPLPPMRPQNFQVPSVIDPLPPQNFQPTFVAEPLPPQQPQQQRVQLPAPPPMPIPPPPRPQMSAQSQMPPELMQPQAMQAPLPSRPPMPQGPPPQLQQEPQLPPLPSLPPLPVSPDQPSMQRPQNPLMQQQQAPPPQQRPHDDRRESRPPPPAGGYRSIPLPKPTLPDTPPPVSESRKKSSLIINPQPVEEKNEPLPSPSKHKATPIITASPTMAQNSDKQMSSDELAKKFKNNAEQSIKTRPDFGGSLNSTGEKDLRSSIASFENAKRHAKGSSLKINETPATQEDLKPPIPPKPRASKKPKVLEPTPKPPTPKPPAPAPKPSTPTPAPPKQKVSKPQPAPAPKALEPKGIDPADARAEVEAALSGVSFEPDNNPIEAINAQRLEDAPDIDISHNSTLNLSDANQQPASVGGDTFVLPTPQ